MNTIWTDMAKQALGAVDVPNELIARYAEWFGAYLKDQAEQFATDDIPEKERERDEAAYDHHINRLIDEARGK